MPVFASGGSRNLLKKGFLRIFQNFLVRFAGRSGHSLTFIGSKHQGSSLTGSSNINNISFFCLNQSSSDVEEWPPAAQKAF